MAVNKVAEKGSREPGTIRANEEKQTKPKEVSYELEARNPGPNAKSWERKAVFYVSIVLPRETLCCKVAAS